MRYEIDAQFKIVDFYIEDESGTEVAEGMNFDDVLEMIEELLKKLKEVM